MGLICRGGWRLATRAATVLRREQAVPSGQPPVASRRVADAAGRRGATILSYSIVVYGNQCTDRQTNLLQGTLDLLILKSLALGELHGLGVARRVEQITRGTFQVKPGSLFPALYRMEEAGWLTSSWGASENNRRAKFYKLDRRRTATARRGDQRVEAHCRRDRVCPAGHLTNTTTTGAGAMSPFSQISFTVRSALRNLFTRSRASSAISTTNCARTPIS